MLGGGWYGCHIALELIRDGHEVELWEKGGQLFGGASGNNQNRLHLGFHYPRDGRTRQSSREGFGRFMEAYPSLSAEVDTNLYAVADDSLVDWDTYWRSVGIGRPYRYGVRDPKLFGLVNVQGVLSCHERVVLPDRAREHFASALAGVAHCGIAGDRLPCPGDVQIDCTNGAFGAGDWDRTPCILHELETDRDDLAITVMDGPFFSIYPTGQPGCVTLSSVPHTHGIEEFGNYDRMANLAKQFLPDFDEHYRYSRPLHSTKCRPRSRSDNRCVSVTRDGNVIRVLPGKIDAIFTAADQVKALLV